MFQDFGSACLFSEKNSQDKGCSWFVNKNVKALQILVLKLHRGYYEWKTLPLMWQMCPSFWTPAGSEPFSSARDYVCACWQVRHQWKTLWPLPDPARINIRHTAAFFQKEVNLILFHPGRGRSDWPFHLNIHSRTLPGHTKNDNSKCQ